MLKFPKDIDTHQNVVALTELFHSRQAPLRKDSPMVVSALTIDEPMAEALGIVKGTNHIVQGLEKITKLLDKEKKGIDAVRVKATEASSSEPRMSRMMFVSNDGTDRFFRGVESLGRRHKNWVWFCRFDVDAERLGALLSTKGTLGKAFLIDDRKALGLFLSNLADRLPPR